MQVVPEFPRGLALLRIIQKLGEFPVHLPGCEIGLPVDVAVEVLQRRRQRFDNAGARGLDRRFRAPVDLEPIAPRLLKAEQILAPALAGRLLPPAFQVAGDAAQVRVAPGAAQFTQHPHRPGRVLHIHHAALVGRIDLQRRMPRRGSGAADQ